MNKQLHELVNEAKLKARSSENIANLRNHLNESYQEYGFLNMKIAFERLLTTLENLAKQVIYSLTQENVNSKCFAHLLASPNKYASSLLSLS